VIDGNPALPQQLFDITIASGIAEISPHAAQEELTRKVTPCEELRLVHERSPVV
jgi:hypothetical protein